MRAGSTCPALCWGTRAWHGPCGRRQLRERGTGQTTASAEKAAEDLSWGCVSGDSEYWTV